eukprot:SAG11_NODE_20784_length_438_cov_1.008850_1_plen_117_part_01
MLRVCGVVGAFAELGATFLGAALEPMTADERRFELYNRVWREMRIPATISIVDAAQAAPEAWAQCKSECEEAGQEPGQGMMGLCRVLNTVVRRHNDNTAVSYIPAPDLPPRDATVCP